MMLMSHGKEFDPFRHVMECLMSTHALCGNAIARNARKPMRACCAAAAAARPDDVIAAILALGPPIGIQPGALECQLGRLARPSCGADSAGAFLALVCADRRSRHAPRGRPQLGARGVAGGVCSSRPTKIPTPTSRSRSQSKAGDGAGGAQQQNARQQ